MFGRNNNNKANFFDVLGLLLFGAIFVTVVVAVFIGQSKLNDSFDEFMLDAPEGYNATFEVGHDIVNDTTTKYPKFWDWLLIFVFLCFWIIMIIAAFVNSSNSIFMVIYWLMSFALVVVSIGMESFLQGFINSSFIIPYADFFPMTTWLLNNFFIYAILLIVTVGVATYIKPKQTYDLFR